ncbi:hypothetical protein B0H17DRAFT_1127349 [Mycena rosella]|uniref:Uncharacterized protein n=1 Tax=Mycena rosella TaxID=1033263 RepID=A0AAD7GNJ2_MYCRO|nr:hypothetical protein B0H17DRAFT_1127349 [Mycena rosella]
MFSSKFEIDPNRDYDKRPYSEAELDIILDRPNQLQALQHRQDKNDWQADSMAGWATRFHTDVHVHPVNNKYSIVYWGGHTAEQLGLWSYHIAVARPNPVAFDEVLDRNVVLAEERLSIIVDVGDGEDAFQPLQDGGLVAAEGDTVYLVHAPLNRPTTKIPITFPHRVPRKQQPNHIVLPA